MEDFEYIKNFSKITIVDICKKCKVDKSNLYSNRVTKEKLHLVRSEIENRIARLYIKNEEEKN